MHRIRRIAISVSVLVYAAAALGDAAQATAPKNDTGGYDELPSSPPSELAQLFHSALAVPNVAEWLAKDRQDLLDVVTVRYKNRLIDRAPSPSPQRTRRYVEELSESPLAQEFPNVVRQTCAQYGFTGGACAKHRSYVRRALVLEEMLAQSNLSLDQMEVELVGETRLKLSAWQADPMP